MSRAPGYLTDLAAELANVARAVGATTLPEVEKYQDLA